MAKGATMAEAIKQLVRENERLKPLVMPNEIKALTTETKD